MKYKSATNLHLGKTIAQVYTSFVLSKTSNTDEHIFASYIVNICACGICKSGYRFDKHNVVYAIDPNNTFFN